MSFQLYNQPIIKLHPVILTNLPIFPSLDRVTFNRIELFFLGRGLLELRENFQRKKTKKTTQHCPDSNPSKKKKQGRVHQSCVADVSNFESYYARIWYSDVKWMQRCGGGIAK